MKKSTALTLAGLMAISGAASASMSRVNGFGASSAFIADVTDIWTLPGVVASNPNSTYFEYGTAPKTISANAGSSAFDSRPSNVWGGAHLTLGPGVLAIYGNRPYHENSNLMSQNTPTTGNTAPSALLVPLNQIDLIYGFAVNDGLTLAVGITRGVSQTAKETAPSGGSTSKVESSSSDFGISLGAEIKNLGPIALLEVGLQYDMQSVANSNNNGSTTDKITGTGSDLDLRIGADIKGDKNAFQRIEIGLNTDSMGLKDEPNTAPASGSFVESKDSAMAWNLGWAKGMSSDKGMGLGGFMLNGLSQSLDEAGNGFAVNKTDASSLTLSFVCAGEAKVKDWLTARAGLSSNLFQTTSNVAEAGASGSTTKVTTSTSGSPATTLSTGLSLNFGDITIDGVLNKDMLYNGPFFVNGIPTTLFSQVSATWAWGGAKE